MKHLLLLLLIMPVIGFSQGTTQEEYLFMKNGYKDVLEKGTDMKYGYYEQAYQSQMVNNISLVVTEFNRVKDSSNAGIIIIMTSNNFRQYFAIPAGNSIYRNSYGWDEWEQDLADMSKQQLLALNVLISRGFTREIGLIKDDKRWLRKHK